MAARTCCTGLESSAVFCNAFFSISFFSVSSFFFSSSFFFFAISVLLPLPVGKLLLLLEPLRPCVTAFTRSSTYSLSPTSRELSMLALLFLPFLGPLWALLRVPCFAGSVLFVAVLSSHLWSLSHSRVS